MPKRGTGPVRSVLGGTHMIDVTNRFIDWLSALGVKCSEREGDPGNIINVRCSERERIGSESR